MPPPGHIWLCCSIIQALHDREEMNQISEFQMINGRCLHFSIESSSPTTFTRWWQAALWRAIIRTNHIHTLRAEHRVKYQCAFRHTLWIHHIKSHSNHIKCSPWFKVGYTFILIYCIHCVHSPHHTQIYTQTYKHRVSLLFFKASKTGITDAVMRFRSPCFKDTATKRHTHTHERSTHVLPPNEDSVVGVVWSSSHCHLSLSPTKACQQWSISREN